MSYTLEGNLHKIFPKETKGESFVVREFVVDNQDETYPQFIKFQATQDKVDALDKVKEGDIVKVHFDLRGRQWEDKFFTNLNAWRIEGLKIEKPLPTIDEVKNSGIGIDDKQDVPF